MAVVYPSEDDQRALVSFTDFFTKQETVQALLRVTPQDAQTVSEACASVLTHLESMSRLILASVPLNHITDAEPGANGDVAATVVYQAGSVYPHVLQHSNPMGYEVALSDTAGAAPPLLHHPRSFLATQRDAIDLMVAELESAKDTLLSLNATYGYLWTTNVEELRHYIAQEERRQRMQQPVWERAQMRPASPNGAAAPKSASTMVSVAVPKNAAAPDAAEATSTAEAPEQPPAIAIAPVLTYRTLLVLDATQLPTTCVQHSFMKFIQACDSLREWADSVVGLLTGRDDVPRAGTFEVPSRRDSTPQRRIEASPQEAAERRPVSQGTATAARRPATKTVRVVRYEIRDVTHIYDMFYQQAECFYLPEYALFDTRIKQRLLQPSYFYAMRILMDDMTVEMTRLEHIAAPHVNSGHSETRMAPFDAYTQGGISAYPGAFGMAMDTSSQSNSRHFAEGSDAAKIVFRPTLPQFAFLRNTLRVLLSLCLNEDDRTCLKRHERIYQELVASARDAVGELQHLPKPPQAVLEACSVRGGAGSAGRRPRELVMVSSEGMAHDAQSSGKAAWVVSAEDRGRLRGGFEAYWELRDAVHALKTSLDKDIHRKDETHRTRVLSACVARHMDPVAIMAQERERERQDAVLRARRESGGWFGAARASLRSLVGIAACKAEVQMEDLGVPTVPRRDDEGVEMTTTSPYHAEKVLLQESVNRLWAAVEAHGVHMEREYPGLFYRGERQRWARRVGSLVEKANAVSVVFSS